MIMEEERRPQAVYPIKAVVPDLFGAFRLMMVRIATERRLPFEPLVPNDETIEAMKAARRADLVVIGDVERLMADLNADD